MLFDPHFILLDFNLPRVHGTLVAKHLRLNEDGVSRVIVATSGASIDDVRCPQCDLHLPKPIDVRALLDYLHATWDERFAGTPWCS